MLLAKCTNYNPGLRSKNTLIYETANSSKKWGTKGETEAKIAIGTAHTQRKGK
jgi:hypothetical protein